MGIKMQFSQKNEAEMGKEEKEKGSQSPQGFYDSVFAFSLRLTIFLTSFRSMDNSALNHTELASVATTVFHQKMLFIVRPIQFKDMM